MKPQETWQFSDALDRVDVRRILREARVAYGNVVRFNVDGKTYTAWLEADHPDYDSGTPKGYWYGDLNKVHRKPGRENGPVFIHLERSPGFYEPIRICRGDHVGGLLDRVEVRVEVFSK